MGMLKHNRLQSLIAGLIFSGSGLPDKATHFLVIRCFLSRGDMELNGTTISGPTWRGASPSRPRNSCTVQFHVAPREEAPYDQKVGSFIRQSAARENQASNQRL